MALGVLAQGYPARPVRLIVPFPPGGTTDIIARVLRERSEPYFGQTFIVDNRAGAGGTVGANMVAKAAPDGYTLGVATVSTIAAAPAIDPKVPYNPIADFTPIINVAATPNVMVVHPSFPATDYAGFVAELKKNPGKYSYASPGTGSLGHLSTELFKAQAGVSLVHIPYKGAGPALIDVVGGQVLVMLDNLPSSLPHIKSRRLVALAAASEKRITALPDVPTLAEVGLPQVNRVAFYGIHGPKGLPPEVRRKVHAAVRQTLDDPFVRTRIEETGSSIIGNTPEAFARQIREEFEIYRRVVETQKLRIE